MMLSFCESSGGDLSRVKVISSVFKFDPLNETYVNELLYHSPFSDIKERIDTFSLINIENGNMHHLESKSMIFCGLQNEFVYGTFDNFKRA
jgi:hypothetical protein